jgi:peroxiredoxin
VGLPQHEAVQDGRGEDDRGSGEERGHGPDEADQHENERERPPKGGHDMWDLQIQFAAGRRARVRRALHLSSIEIPQSPNPMALSVGAQAPAFTLKSKTANGLRDVSLSANLGKKNTVLLFFPLAFTGVCTQEMCDVSSGLNSYSDLGAEVIAVSVDSPFAQEAWALKENIGITIASDLNKTTAKNYDVLLDDLAGIGSASARAAFVIDKSGVIQYAEQTPTPKDLPNFEAVKAKLAELQ